MKAQVALLAALLVCLPQGGETEQAPGKGATAGKLFVDVSAADYIEVIDLEARKTVDKIKVGLHPHGLVVDPETTYCSRAPYRFLFVTVEQTGELVIVDADRHTVVERIKVGNVPNQLTVTTYGFAYVPLREEAKVAVVKILREVVMGGSPPERSRCVSIRPHAELVKRIPIGEWPHNAYTGQTTGRVYVTSFKGKKIHVFDPEKKHELVYEMEFPGEVRPMALSWDETRAYVAQSGFHGFLVADLVERKIIERVELPPLPEGTPVPYLNTYVHGLTLSPDEKELWVTSCAGAAVYVYSVPGLKLLGKVATGKFPHWFAWEERDDDSWLLWVSQMESNQVSAIDPVKREVVATIPTGPAPRRIAISNQ
jgi:YVTN family beta-propeller protein